MGSVLSEEHLGENGHISAKKEEPSNWPLRKLSSGPGSAPTLRCGLGHIPAPLGLNSQTWWRGRPGWQGPKGKEHGLGADCSGPCAGSTTYCVAWAVSPSCSLHLNFLICALGLLRGFSEIVRVKSTGSGRGNEYYYCHPETPSGPLVPGGTAGDLGQVSKET